MSLLPLDEGVDDGFEELVLVGSVEVRLVEVLEMIAESRGCKLLSDVVRYCDYVYLFR